jgi:hypothetical protein
MEEKDGAVGSWHAREISKRRKEIYLRRMMLHLFQQQPLPPSFPPPVCLQLPTQETTPTVTQRKKKARANSSSSGGSRENNLPVPSRLERSKVNRLAVESWWIVSERARHTIFNRPSNTSSQLTKLFFILSLYFIFFIIYLFIFIFFTWWTSSRSSGRPLGDIVCPSYLLGRAGVDLPSPKSRKSTHERI